MIGTARRPGWETDFRARWRQFVGSERAQSLTLLGALVLARAALVLSLAECFFGGEELAHGTSAKALLDGLGVPLPRLAYQHYEGGGLLAALITAPLFASLGPSLLSLKLVAFGFDALNLLLGRALAARCFGIGAAWIFGGLYVFGPNACQQMALLNVGNHHMAIGPYFLIALLALRLTLREPGERARVGTCLALGLAAGFGCFLNFLCIPLVGFFALALIALPPRLLDARAWSLLALGWCVGFAPGWWTMHEVGLHAYLDIHGVHLLDSLGAPPTAADGPWLLALLFAALDLRGELQLVALTALPLLGAAWWLRGRAAQSEARRAQRAFALLAAYLVALSLASVFSRFAPTYFSHYGVGMRFLPHWALAALLSAAVLARASASPRRALARAARALALLLVCAGASGTLALARAGAAENAAQAWRLLVRTKGYSYEEYLPKLSAHLEGSPAERLAVVLRFDESDPGPLRAAAMSALLPELPGGVRPLVAWAREHDPEGWLQLLHGAGGRLVRADMPYPRMLRLLEQSEFDAATRASLERALGQTGPQAHLGPRAFEREVEALIAEHAPPSAYFGAGVRIQAGFRLAPRAGREFVLGFGPLYAPQIARGFEYALAWNTLGAPPAPAEPLSFPEPAPPRVATQDE